MNILKVSNLTKTYKVAVRNSGLKNAFKSFIKKEYSEVKAVDDISFELKKGEIVGLIGPNGAGKSTTIKMLTGILKPDSGNIKVLGMNPSEERVKYVKNIGVVFGQKSQLWWDIPAEDSFDLSTFSLIIHLGIIERLSPMEMIISFDFENGLNN